MKILVANHWLKKKAGSETFTYTLCEELRKQGHEVDLFTHVTGEISRRICNNFKIKLVSAYNDDHYDLILANHKTTVEVLSSKGFTVQTVHGIYPKLEKPNLKANMFVAISKEIKEWLETRDLYSELIWNGIDCKRFRILSKINQQPKKVLSLSTSEPFNQQLRTEFLKRGITLIALNKFKNPVWDVENYMNNVDMVISLGRGAYEALACGRPVLVLDNRQYMEVKGDGIVTPENILDLIECNFSGRKLNRNNVPEMIDEALELYDYRNSDFYRNFAFNNLNIEKQVQKYLNLK